MNKKERLRALFLFFIANMAIGSLVALRYVKYCSPEDDFFSILYIVLTLLGHFFFLSLIPFLFVALPLCLIFKNSAIAKISSIVLGVLLNSILIIDTFIYNLYRFHINSFTLELIFGGAGSQIFELGIGLYLLVFGGIVTFIILQKLLMNLCFKFSKEIKTKVIKITTIFLITSLIISHISHTWADAVNYKTITSSSRCFPLYFPLTANRFLIKIGAVDPNSKKNRIFVKTNSVLNYPKNKLQFDSNINKQNILIITLDSWNKFITLNKETMPNINEFSKNCISFNNHTTGCPGTGGAIFSIFYGIPGTYWNEFTNTETQPVLVKKLLDENYQLGIFTSASLYSPPFYKNVFSHIENLRLETKGVENSCERDATLTQEWLKFLDKNNGQKIFSFLFYDALHSMTLPKNSKNPYKPTWEYAKYQLLNNDIDPTEFINLYKNIALYEDSLVGIVLNDLKKRNILKNSIIIITADHGQEFNENKKNYWGHYSNFTKYQMEVPFLYYSPNIKPENISRWTTHYDIPSTLLENVFKCKNNSSDYSIGKNIFDTKFNRTWSFVGAKEIFGIIDQTKIVKIYFDGSFDITDKNLNPTSEKIDAKQYNEIMKEVNSFYK